MASAPGSTGRQVSIGDHVGRELSDDDDDTEYMPGDDDESTDVYEDVADEEDENDEEDDQNEDEDEESQTTVRVLLTVATVGNGAVMLTRDLLMRLLSNAGREHAFFRPRPAARGPANDDDDDDEEEEEEGEEEMEEEEGDDGEDEEDEISAATRLNQEEQTLRRKRLKRKVAFEPVPNKTGEELMRSGTFGVNRNRDNSSLRHTKKVAYRTMMRELGLGSPGMEKSSKAVIAQGLLPSSKAETVYHYDARCYSGQFSEDGNFFFCCSQDFNVRMYDTSNPYDWKQYKTVTYHDGQWTITDASLSPDNRFLAYSSIRNIVCLAPTDPADDSEPLLLDFASSHRRVAGNWGRYSYFGIWSLRYSGDGREIVAGTSDHSVCVYDVERRQSVLEIPGHAKDVNAVCFGDKHSPHVLYSGSDDTTLKVWDRRSLAGGREAGVFYGHTEGLTYVDSKGDGRYILSNAKDQTAKLWDLRMMLSREKAESILPHSYTTDFEYRTDSFNYAAWRPHPHDCSLVTFRGHSVLKTLIRCHFSPPGSTDSRYVYSGSEDGSVYIWNMDATLQARVDVLQSTKNSRPRMRGSHNRSFDFFGQDNRSWKTCVRDASWHPYAPVIAATSWNGWGTSFGTCTVHVWNGGDGEEQFKGQDRKAELDCAAAKPRSSEASQNRRRRTNRRPRDEDEDDNV